MNLHLRSSNARAKDDADLELTSQSESGAGSGQGAGDDDAKFRRASGNGRRIRRVLLILLGVAVAGAAYLRYAPSIEQRTVPRTFRVEKGEFTVKISEIGELRALDSVTVSAAKDLPIIWLAPPEKVEESPPPFGFCTSTTKTSRIQQIIIRIAKIVYILFFF